MRTGRLIATAGLALLGLVANAKASPITYTESATVSGSLNGVSFTNELLTLTGTGDTASVASGFYFTNVVSATFSLAGFGSGTFTESIDVFDNQSVPGAGFQKGPAGGLDLLDILNNAALASYALTTSIGPITGSPAINSGTSFSTSRGPLILTSFSGDTTFTANAGTVSAVPLPGAFPLFATGLAGLGLLGWRRKRKDIAA
jgi:hypothetical protein